MDKCECEFGCVYGRKSEVCQTVVEWREVTTRMMLLKVKSGREVWILVSVYGTGSKRNDDDGENFWNGVQSFWAKSENYTVV